MIRKLFRPLLLPLGLCLQLQAGTTFTPAVDPAANVRIEIQSWLETCPQYGMVPLKVRIHNGGNKAQTWKVKVGNGNGGAGSMLLETKVTVEAGKEGSAKIYAPVTVPTDSGYYYGSAEVMVEGPAITNQHAGNIHSNSSGYRNNSTEFIGMGKKLSSKGWSALRDRVKENKSSSSAELIGSELDMAGAPDDWRGYSGLAQLWLDAGEWISLDENVKGAILDWVAMGGRLFVLNAGALGPDVREVFPMLTGEVDSIGKLRHGSGEVETFSWDGKTFPLQAVYQRVQKAGESSLGQKLDDYDGKWLLKDKVGELTLRSGLIFSFIVVFGLLVGPLNLFWLAGAKRRHRLFWTTPALSLAGSALLVALMILQDGTGGSGARMVLVTLLPEQKKLAVTQEQVARTGVLMGGTFPVAEAGWMLPLDLDNEQRGGYNSSDRGRASFFDDGQNRWGDWFSSRSVQGHLLRSVRPSRASVELFPDADPTAPPSVVSSVEVSLAKLFVVDDASRYWVAEDVGTGEKKVLRPATKNDYQAWLRSRVQDLAGPVIQHSINEMKARPGTIFAEAADPSRLAVPTLNAIRWNDNVALIAGRYVKRS